jgi:hypothetical protein
MDALVIRLLMRGRWDLSLNIEIKMNGTGVKIYRWVISERVWSQLEIMPGNFNHKGKKKGWESSSFGII